VVGYLLFGPATRSLKQNAARGQPLPLSKGDWHSTKRPMGVESGQNVCRRTKGSPPEEFGGMVPASLKGGDAEGITQDGKKPPAGAQESSSGNNEEDTIVNTKSKKASFCC
jgi:hypothetical protein